ncbi:AbrB/MazE/SpoVT family DNA-binding domain-containing protein [Arthrobacter sp. H5]|uniref:AbrB/MazE/SpoVT family DNA-binding domain-containing protein n=1 Tax=Arthrobacter sp. H5 TaxID=1267973 RepID=UPI000564EC11|nr:AbrB/MazE/SpoVT family DNA-binding domain-containing protein [Arthrobacter sp. H5]
MKAILTVSSKGQITLPVAMRESLGLKKGDQLEATIDPAAHRLTISPVISIEELSERVTGYAKKREPVTDVNGYYQSHRST